MTRPRSPGEESHVVAAGEGPGSAWWPPLYDCLHGLAQRALARERTASLQPTALAHEAWLRLAGARSQFDDEAHMRGAVALTLRAVLVDHARRRATTRRGADRLRVSFSEADGPMACSGIDGADLLSLDEALHELAEQHPRAARVVELRFFGGLTVSETAQRTGMARSTVDDQWHFARAWLHRALRR